MSWLWEHTKYLAVALGIVAGSPFIWSRRDRMSLKKWQVPLVGIGFSAASVLGAMLFAMLEQTLGGTDISFGAISLYGVYIIGPLFILAVAKLLKLDIAELFDLYAIYALPSMFLMRCNCLKSGCCGGIRFFSTGLAWPTREIEMVFYVVMVFVLLGRDKKGAKSGTAFPLLMCCYAALRFWLEWFRIVDGGALFHLSHIWSMFVLATGFLLYRKQTAGGAKQERGCNRC